MPTVTTTVAAAGGGAYRCSSLCPLDAGMVCDHSPMQRRLLRISAVLVTLLAVVGTMRLTLPAVGGPDSEPPGVRRQLAFLRDAMEEGAGERTQQLFPEGYFFLSALYGLTWVELGLREPPESRAEALAAARWALARLDSPAGRAPFSSNLSPPYGVFHAGWSAWLRGGILALQPADRRNAAEVQELRARTAQLAAAFDSSVSPYLQAYPGQSWPVDSTVAIAALRLHDQLFPARYQRTVDRWLSLVRQHLDPATGLLPHRADPTDGRPLEIARATSQSLMHRFLVEIDADFARAQYLRFRDLYVTRPAGLDPAVREYPAGAGGEGDVDSGPLILGVSLSATVVTIGAAQVQGDTALAGALANYAELTGAPVGLWRTKRYALGALPIGDAFLAWAKSARPWVAPPQSPPPRSIGWWWRLPVLAGLAIVGLLPWLYVAHRRWRHRKPGSAAVLRVTVDVDRVS